MSPQTPRPAAADTPRAPVSHERAPVAVQGRWCEREQAEPEGMASVRGGAWILEGELVARFRELPGWRRPFRFFLPMAFGFALLALVAAYFGIPTALLNAMAVASALGHVWPSWRAREVADYWTPVERYLGVTFGERALQVCSAGAVREVSIAEIRGISRLPEGWLLWFRDKPPLWLPRGAIGEAQAGVIDVMLRGLPAPTSNAWLPWSLAIGGGASVAGTALWYLSA